MKDKEPYACIFDLQDLSASICYSHDIVCMDAVVKFRKYSIKSPSYLL